MIAKFFRSREGGTAIEYSMIAAFIALGIITALTVMGTKIDAMFVAVNAGFKP